MDLTGSDRTGPPTRGRPVAPRVGGRTSADSRDPALLAIFGKNVEDAFGHVRYLAFYVAGGFVASMTQAVITLLAGTAADGRVPTLGASGAIAAVLGAYFVLYPSSRVLTLELVFLVRIPAWVFLGAWSSRPLIRAGDGRHAHIV